MNEGDLEGAEKLLLQSFEQSLKIKAEGDKAAAAVAFALGSLKDSQLEYHSAKKYYEQAVQLEPDNTEYINYFGLILRELGEYENAIKSYEKELEEKEKITRLIYGLLHSISHSLMLTGSVECGLDKNSLAELIMPSIPAIIIYSNNIQNFQTGGMFTLFENNISPWIEKTLNKVERCIYDPVCMDHKSACHACLYLSEISCVHFNYDLGK